MHSHFIVNTIDPYTVIEFRLSSLMDPRILEEIGNQLYPLVDEQDKRLIILDFTNVHYLSSQAIGLVLNLHKKLGAIKRSKMILCGVGPKLMELMKITRLDRVLTIKATQAEAVKVLPP